MTAIDQSAFWHVQRILLMGTVSSLLPDYHLTARALLSKTHWPHEIDGRDMH